MPDFFNPYNQPPGYGGGGLPPGAGGYGYGASTPMVDFRRRENQNRGNSAMTPPLGMQTGNPFFDMGATAVMRQYFPDKEFKSFGGFDGTDVDFRNARTRHDQAYARYGEISRMSPVFGGDDRISQNPAFQQMADQMGFKYGGSSIAAFNSAYGRFGHMVSRDPNVQASTMVQFAQNMDDAFSSGEGKERKWDYQKSFGFTRAESVENMDSAHRFGMTGMNNAQLAKAIQEGRGTEVMKKANEVTRLGKGTFGQDQSADQINELLDKAMGGIEGVKPEKASEFLAKVQSAARALDVDAKGFAEYIAAKQQLYKSMGVGGTAGYSSAIRSALESQVLSQRAKGEGSEGIADKNRADAANQANRAAAAGSSFNREMTFIAAQVDQMSPEEERRAAGGNGARNTLRRIEELTRAGDTAGAESLKRQLSGDVGGVDHVRRAAGMMNDETVRRGEENFDTNAKAQGNNEGIRKSLMSSLEREARARGVSDEGLEAFRRVAPELSRHGMTDERQKLARQLQEQGLNPEEAQRQSKILTEAAQVSVTNVANVGRYGINSKDRIDVALDATTASGKRQIGEAAAQARQEDEEIRRLNTQNGDKTRPMNAGDFAPHIQKLVKEASEKGEKGDWGGVGKAVMNALGEATMTDRVTQTVEELKKSSGEQPDGKAAAETSPGEVKVTDQKVQPGTTEFRVPDLSPAQREAARVKAMENATQNPAVKTRGNESSEDAIRRLEEGGSGSVRDEFLAGARPAKTMREPDAESTGGSQAKTQDLALSREMRDFLKQISENTTPANGGPVARTADRFSQ